MLTLPETMVAAEQSVQSVSFLSFQIDQSLWGILPTAQLAEIFPATPEQVVAIGGSAPTVMGVTHWRGEVLWLLDVSAMLRSQRLIDRAMPLTQYQVIVVRCAQGHVGLVAGQVGQTHWLDPQASITPQPSDPDMAIMSALVQGYWSPAIGPSGPLGASGSVPNAVPNSLPNRASEAPTYVWLDLPGILQTYQV
jgi:positive phototaxis protein PixI